MAEIPKTPRDAGAELERRFRSTERPIDPPGLGERTVPVLAEAATRMPVYYRTGLFNADGSPADVLDIVDALWGDESNYIEKDVLKYLVRAGKKPGVPAERDWLKIVRVAARKYRTLTGEDLPDDI